MPGISVRSGQVEACERMRLSGRCDPLRTRVFSWREKDPILDAEMSWSPERQFRDREQERFLFMSRRVSKPAWALDSVRGLPSTAG